MIVVTDHGETVPRLRQFRFTFGIGVMLATVALIAVGVVLFLIGRREPMRQGRIYSAICYASDWQATVASQLGESQGEYALYTFDVASTNELFKPFSTKPLLWAGTEIAKEVGDFRPARPERLLCP